MPPRNAAASAPTTRKATVYPGLCQRLPLMGKFGSGSCGVTALFFCVLVHTRFCLYPSRVFVSLVLCNFSKQILVTFKVRLPGVSQSLWQIPSLGSLLWGPESLEQCEKFFGIIVLQFVDHPPSGFMVGLMVISSKRAYVNMLCLPGRLQPVPQLLGRLLLTHKSAGDLHSLTGRSISVSSGGHCSFPWVLMHTRY